jgi:UDP-N-acetylglucosamine:LPS N-acetylglucosamine transferase
MLKESELAGDTLGKRIRELIADEEKLRGMSVSATALAPKNAAALIVDTIERYTQPHDAVAA